MENAPPGPGVYTFLDAAGDVIYVGTTGNLRRRLRQHAAAGPATSHLHRRYELVRAVRWEEAPSVEAAAWREDDLIFALRPPFNADPSRGMRPSYVVVRQDGARWCFTLEPDLPSRGTRVYGCFPHLGKGTASRLGIACSDGYVAFLRLVWAASGDGKHMPTVITRAAPARFEVGVDAGLARAIGDLLAGVSARAIDQLGEVARDRPQYMQPALARDRDAARGFFTAGPKRLRDLRRRHGLPPRPVEADEYRRLVRADFGVR